MRAKWLFICLICCLVIVGCKAKEKVIDDGHDLIDEINDEVAGGEDELPAMTDDNPSDEGDSDDINAEDEEEINRWVNEYEFEIGNTYPIYGKTLIHELPESIVSHIPVGMTRTGDKYIFTEIVDDLVKVKTADISGWVSIWYFTDEAKAIKQVEPYEMNVFTPTVTSFYPGGETAYSMELGRGKVVQVYKEYQEWVAVHALFGDAINAIDMWIKKDKLTDFDPDFSNEGVLKLGGKIYNEEGRVKEESSGFPLFITGEKDGMFSFEAPGGKVGFIQKEDFEPNPFAEPTLAMIFTVRDGTEASYIVEHLSDHHITHRYFDYNSGLGPEEETNTVAFEEMLAMDNGQRLYDLELWLVYPLSGVQLKPTAGLTEQIETNPEFRKRLGVRLGKPIDGVSHDLSLTIDMIRK